LNRCDGTRLTLDNEGTSEVRPYSIIWYKKEAWSNDQGQIYTKSTFPFFSIGT